MNDQEIHGIHPLRIGLGLSVLLNFYLSCLVLRPTYGLGRIFGFSGKLLVALLPIFMLIGAASILLGLSFTPRREAVLLWTGKIFNTLRRPKMTSIFLGLLSAIIIFLAYYLFRADSWNKYLAFIWFFGNVIWIRIVFFSGGLTKKAILFNLLGTALAYSVIFEVFIYGQNVSSYPLSMGWSEGSRYYYASLFFAQRLYGQAFSLPTLDPSAYLLQAIPFLIPSLPLWFHRLWVTLLWLVVTGVGSACIVRRFKPTSRWMGWLLTMWGFLFFIQAPIYFQLFLAAILVLAGFNLEHPLRTTLLVLIASAWAGISRVNWFPVPASLAVAMYILEKPLAGKSWRYWITPFLWMGSGLLTALAAYRAYILISHNPPEVFFASLTAPLLKYRLLPNSTYPDGILLGLGITIFPLVFILLTKFIPSIKAWHPLRTLALITIFGVYLLGGIIVSIRIGGGNNLHNLDSFLIFLVLVTGYLVFNRFKPDWPEKVKTTQAIKIAYVLAALIPIMVIMMQNPGVNQLAKDYPAELSSLQQEINQAQQNGGDVLFVTQRQLVTFGLLQVKNLDPEYEKVSLMEMAMADNRNYLDSFDAKLAEHHYALIIFEPLTGAIQTRDSAFSEENNAWYTNVTLPVLQNYKLKTNYPALEIAVLEPDTK